MGHALRSREQRGGRARGKSPPQVDARGRRATARDGARSGVQPAAGRRSGDLADPLIPPGAALLPAGALLSIVLGVAVRLAGAPDAALLISSPGLAVTGLPVAWRTLRGVASGRFAADLVAMLAIVAALLLGQPLAGLIVVLMQTGGEALERYAEGRASRAVRELEAAAPRGAHRITVAGVEDISADSVIVGDKLLVRPGEFIACDAIVL